MKSLFSLVMLLGLLAACSSGDVELVQVDNPESAQDSASATPRPTAADALAVEETPTAVVAPTAVSTRTPEAEPTTELVESADDELDDEADPNETDLAEADEDVDGLDEEADVDEGAETELELGLVDVEVTDEWCVAATKVNDNYLTLNGLDRTDPEIFEAAFRQIHDSLETAVQIAPSEIGTEVETERWVWDRMITIHEDADWNLTALPIEQIVELSETNVLAMETVDNFTARECG